MSDVQVDDIIYYSDKLSPTEQINMEERIASMIFNDPEVATNEETAASLGRGILWEVLRHFRPDLFQSGIKV